MIVSIHLSEEEEHLFKNYADFIGVDLSTLFKRALLEKIELEHELNIIAAYEKEKTKGTLELFDVEEVMDELGVQGYFLSLALMVEVDFVDGCFLIAFHFFSLI